MIVQGQGSPVLKVLKEHTQFEGSCPPLESFPQYWLNASHNGVVLLRGSWLMRSALSRLLRALNEV
eukprot:1148280-Pelagomonas_calceolata.AAC.2